jgi:hypothetical protein
MNDNDNVHLPRINIKSISQCAQETTVIGYNVITSLSSQGDLMKQTDNKLEYNDYYLSNTIRILRKMSWFGWIINFFTRTAIEPKVIFETNKINENENDCNEELNEMSNNNNNNNNNNNKFNYNDSNVHFIETIDAEDKELSELENELIKLHYIGLKINEYLIKHNEELDAIIPKTEDLTNKMIVTKNLATNLI